MHRILNKWLQHERGHGDIVQRRINVEPALQAVAEPGIDECEIGAKRVELFDQRYLTAFTGAKRAAEEIAEPADHVIGGNGIDVNRRRDRVERVEEKMWLQPKAEHLETGVRGIAFDRRGSDFAIAQ